MTDYQKYINALRKCATEHENDRTSTGHIIVSDLCRDTANLLEELEQESTTKDNLGVDCIDKWDIGGKEAELWIVKGKLQVRHRGTIHNIDMPSVIPQEPRKGHWITTRTLMHDGEYYCDKCKNDSPNNEKWDYCPNCGAEMVEPQESEDK